MIKSWDDFYIVMGLQLLFFGVWFWNALTKLSTRYLIFWSIVLIVFFSVPNLAIKCNLESGGLGCLGIGFILGVPWGISALLLSGVVLKEFAGLVKRRINISSPVLPGPGMFWVIGSIIVIYFLSIFVIYNLVKGR